MFVNIYIQIIQPKYNPCNPNNVIYMYVFRAYHQALDTCSAPYFLQFFLYLSFMQTLYAKLCLSHYSLSTLVKQSFAVKELHLLVVNLLNQVEAG